MSVHQALAPTVEPVWMVLILTHVSVFLDSRETIVKSVISISF